MSITVGTCAIVLVGAVVLTNRAEKETGIGGFGDPIAELAVSAGASDAISQSLSEFAAEGEAVDAGILSYSSYRVKKGDMIGKIAEQFGITQDTIISVNGIKNSRTIQPGEFYKIPSQPGILYTVKKNGETVESIAAEKNVDVEKCALANNVETTAELKEGTTIFVPGGKLGWAEIQEINGDLFRKPIHAGWYKSSNFGWRSNPFTGARSFHSGVDMACPTGTAVYAAMPGRVTETGFNATFGNYIIITHASGYKTLYGHLSAILTTRGTYVNQSSRIGKVGSTGMSTGPHLHFTVFKNGKYVNPVALWN